MEGGGRGKRERRGTAKWGCDPPTSTPLNGRRVCRDAFKWGRGKKEGDIWGGGVGVGGADQK